MNNVHFAIPEIYGDTLSYYELLRKLVDKTNYLIDNYNTVPEQIAEAVENLDASQLFSEVLNQLIHSIATDNTKSANAVKVYKKHDLLYATFNETVNLYESLINFSTGTATELIPGTNIREVNISELFIELRKLIDINKNNIATVTSVANENSAAITTIHDDITAIENKNTEQDNEISTLRTMISTPYNFKGDVASISALPASGAVNDTYYVQDVKYKVTWTGSAWVQSSLSEADYQTELGELKGDLSKLGSDGTIPYKIKWEQGNVAGSNPDIYTPDRVRSETGMYYPINGAIIGKVMDNHKIILFFYDENKTFIKNTDWFDEVVYSDFGNAKYVRFMVKKSDGGNIEPNEVEDSFSYSTVVRENKERVREIKESVDILKNNISKFNSDYYVAENVNAIDGSINEYFDAETITELDVFSKYDALMNAHPDYVTRKSLGFDASDNYSIRAYYFTPPYVSILHGDTAQVLDDKPHYKKIILTSGTHGNGAGGDNCESIVALYELAKALCENHVNNRHLYDIRNNYQVIIVPLVNPWGVVNKSRYNSRGVDINRNFTNGWEASEHSGNNSLSEPESIAIDALLSANNDALFCFDVHTRGGDTFQQTYPQILGICTDGDNIEHSFQASIGKVKSKFDGFSADLYRHGVFGCIRSQCRYYNIHSATIECTFMAENNGQKHTALSNKVNIEMLINSIIECIKKYS